MKQPQQPTSRSTAQPSASSEPVNARPGASASSSAPGTAAKRAIWPDLSARPAYDAIFFDLDGTLLPMDMDDFLHKYFIQLRLFATRKGLDAEHFSYAVNESTSNMGTHGPDVTNADAFWERFVQMMDNDRAHLEPLMEDFYQNEYQKVGAGVEPNPLAAQVVEGLHAKGYPLYLTTMPMFPRIAVEGRLCWAGVNPALFARMSTYDNSYALKPMPAYYAQNIRIAGCAPERILMVGNNTREDLGILQLGTDAYLVTDYLIDPDGFDLGTVKHGTLADFARWVATFPECEA
jgi:FMN phosphatase YigB (HAD superfamily)